MPTPDPAMPTIVLHLDGLAYSAPKGHACTAIVRSLPTRSYAGNGIWVIPLSKANLAGLRKLYAAGCTFSPEAIAALQQLRDSTSGGLSSPVRGARLASGTDISPDVVPALRSLPPTLDPFLSGVSGAESPGATATRSSEEPQL